jgi:hypothetical protein
MDIVCQGFLNICEVLNQEQKKVKGTDLGYGLVANTGFIEFFFQSFPKK